MSAFAREDSIYLGRIADAEEKKVAAFNRVANSLLLDHLPGEVRQKIVEEEAEVLELELKKRKLQVLKEIGELEEEHGDDK